MGLFINFLYVSNIHAFPATFNNFLRICCVIFRNDFLQLLSEQAERFSFLRFDGQAHSNVGNSNVSNATIKTLKTYNYHIHGLVRMPQLDQQLQSTFEKLRNLRKRRPI